jgi:hypothetical protein
LKSSDYQKCQAIFPIFSVRYLTAADKSPEEKFETTTQNQFADKIITAALIFAPDAGPRRINLSDRNYGQKRRVGFVRPLSQLASVPRLTFNFWANIWRVDFDPANASERTVDKDFCTG